MKMAPESDPSNQYNTKVLQLLFYYTGNIEYKMALSNLYELHDSIVFITTKITID